MYFLYSILLTFGFIFLMPRFLFDAVRKGKYTDGFWQRLGYLPNFKLNHRPVLWLHCVSVGETQAARPLVKEILENFPNYRLVVSTTTKTGQELAQEVFADQAELIFYMPFDWRFSVRRALRQIKPNVVLIMETELWFNFLREASKGGAGVFIVNGRLSEKSARRYAMIPKTMRRVLHYIDLALMQDAADAKRLSQLGIRGNKVKVTGNVKFDQQFAEAETELTKEFRRRFAIEKDAPLIVAASTHAPEEALIIEAFKDVWKNSTDKLPRLLIAPRHPERFMEAAVLIKNSGFDWVMRSEEESGRDEVAEVILLDSIGELRSVFPLAEIVFVGGSLIPHGGQNVLEPAVVKKAIVTGFYTTNFEGIVTELVKENALVQLPQLNEKEIPPQLAEVFLSLLRDTEKRNNLAQNAFDVMQKNRGASSKTIESLKPFLQVHNNNYII
ncbi:MAG: 3-deoxy-D-manno-octulosonic acid transferase [Acidobacteriota bacterium]|nr:3-deoxy-D-manno-octulosonic acid transferase [Acidobacteriota bacterium]